MLRHRFGEFTKQDRLHFAAHSHHLWPDVTLEAHTRAWQDAADLVDEKWDPIFEELLTATQGHVARVLDLPDPTSIAFSPNVHELIARLGSCFEGPFRLLISDAEFHSMRRQAARWEESGLATVTRVPAEPFDTFPARFITAIQTTDPDLVYLSHVFYDSGYVVPDIAGIAAAADPRTFVVIDGYHAFMALPVDIGPLADRVFYIAGGYKYAMAGEGACFMHCPPGYGMRPVDTGWMAEFGALTTPKDEVAYGPGGTRFFGATFDPSPFYRFNAVQDMLSSEGVGVADIHEHVRALQRRFVDGLDSRVLDVSLLMPAWTADGERGHFLTFRTARAGELRDALRRNGVITDHRGDRLRFGFGIYHDNGDVDALLMIANDLG